MKKLCSALAMLILVAVMCSCSSNQQPEPTESQPLPGINLDDFTDVVVWNQGLDETFNRFTRYVLDQYIIENVCSVSRQKDDGSYVLIIDGIDTDCKITFKGTSDSTELNKIFVDSPCNTETNTNAFFVAGGSMLSACFDKKYSSEYGMKYFFRILENVTNENPMHTEQFGDTKLTITSSNVGMNLCVQHITESETDSSQSTYDGSSLSEIPQQGKTKQESDNTKNNNPTQAKPSQKTQFWDRSESDTISILENIINEQNLFPDMSISLQSTPSENGNLYMAVVNGVVAGVGYSYLSDSDLGKDNLTLLSTNDLLGNDAEAFALLADAMIVESDPSGQYSDLLSANQLIGRLINSATENKGSAEEIVSSVKYKLAVSPTASIFIVKPVQ